MYALTEHEVVTVVARSAERLEVEATYDPGTERPPAHWHPAQTERFAVTAGVLRTRIAGVERDYGAGESFVVPLRTVHCMWNAGSEPTVATWVTEPAGRTEHWFATVAALNPGGGKRDVLAFAVAAHEHRDVFRLATKPAVAGTLAVPVLAAVGRLLGKRPPAVDVP